MGLVVIGAGVVIGSRPLGDNSFLTHLATGRLILDEGSVPVLDPYSFTARGSGWVVQSWLASVLYATVEGVGGLDGVRVLTSVLTGTLAGLGWRLLRPIEGLLARLGVAAVFVTVGEGVWGERPFMLGLIAFALVVLAADGAFDPRWLVPVGWLWVNAHGSFPLGIVYLAVAAAGSRLDGSVDRRQLKSLGWAGVGMLAGAIGPLGLRVLTFPVELLQRQEMLSNVIEWQAPTFESMGERAFLGQIVIAVIVLARRPTYRSALVLAVFVPAALVGSRNISVASIALLPGIAEGLRGVGALAATTRSRLAVPLLALTATLIAVVGVARLKERSIELRPYPIDVLAYLEEREVDLTEDRMAAPELVGNLLTFVYGADGRRVFYDDRFDMYPSPVSEAHLALTNAERSLFADLARYEVDLVAVRVDHPTALVLAREPSWRVLLVGERWQLSCLRGAKITGTIGTC